MALGLMVATSLILYSDGIWAAKPTQLIAITYSSTSPFNEPIPANAEIDPNSARLVGSLQTAASNRGFYIVVDKWTVPVYYADANTPRYTVSLTADWAQQIAPVIEHVPIPDFAAPDPQEDGHMSIVDLSTQCEYDFWQAKKQNGQWSASWANSLKINGAGIYPKGLSARGSGFALLAGMIWPEELISGRIGHALIFSYDYTKAGGPVPPATESDGVSTRLDAIPEGARIQLDPSFDLGSLSLTPYERTIARALQEYGMIVADTGGGLSLYAIHPLSLQDNPYEGLLPTPDPVDGFVTLENLQNLLIAHPELFRVLRLPPQIPDPELALVPSGCTEQGPGGTAALFRIERTTGNVFSDGSFNCGLGTPGPVTAPAFPCFNTGIPADIAERIHASEAIEPGDLVELNPEQPKHHRKARGAYSTLVAGVISTEPGIVMGNQALSTPSVPSLFTESSSSLKQDAMLSLTLSLDELNQSTTLLSGVSVAQVVPYWAFLDAKDDRPVLALVGRVPVRATTENGPIQPGDLLTSSSKPGYAMRCSEAKKCEGAIVGKALQALGQSKGMILMLIMR
jgi:hypothetical protein